MYDVYYTTGGGPWVNAGTDLWVNDFLENVVPHLKVRPVLLIHRNKPKGFEDFEFPIETHWQGDNVGEFEKICDGARRINILHGHYTPMKAIVNNKDKIHSNIRNMLTKYVGKNSDKISILYGGSVNSKNASEILYLKNVDGALVGGASLNAREFCKIIDS